MGSVTLNTPPTGLPQLPEPDLLQLLSPDGTLSTEHDLDPWAVEVTPELLAELHRHLTEIRRLDTEATHLQRQGELALWPPLLGQEAAQVGSALALQEKDYIFPSYRENGALYLRGVDPLGLIRMWRGSTFCGWAPSEHRVGAQQIIIGAQSLHAVGYAMGAAMDGEASATVAYFGDGATSQGDVNEAMVFAASYQAPVVFFCQNNHWAISEPVGLQARRHIADRPWGFGIPSMRVDGNDVLAVLAATRRATERARNGGGPTFIEAVTYRMGPHTTADDPQRYRPEGELEAWRAKDPIDRVEKLIQRRGEDLDAVKNASQQAADALAARIRSGLAQSEEPGPAELFDHVYAEPHSELERQREHYRLYLEQFGDHSLPARSDAAALSTASGTDH
ncbi:pyruvate dehydrogenase (acetyl-transferring) E1 component subunit alpha [Micrococcus terreus]|uniref:pyruvate dehydrogenase (acetyl-transferring) E1 component subunit alpha n=1 Tax=Micrococcus terreus TaxID=574650 RepID=UPI0021A28675|nr:pyruvate dehydrogenase (acetyl-transferring) E1 component subunit alpha [Micrococcus terreus]MCT2088237.1 pyruvate dehydrogenase (acetyl-transferring) E1 component subunit alpha [Micrococcus terreus]